MPQDKATAEDEIRARHARLVAEVRGFERRLARLESRSRKEAADVRAVERLGFAHLVRLLLGAQVETVAKERAEALDAALLRDRARAALASARTDLEQAARALPSTAPGARAEPGRPPTPSTAHSIAPAELAALARATAKELGALIHTLAGAHKTARNGSLRSLLASTTSFDQLDAATRDWIRVRSHVFAIARVTGLRLRLPRLSILAAPHDGWSLPADRDRAYRMLIAERMQRAIDDLQEVRRELLHIAGRADERTPDAG